MIMGFQNLVERYHHNIGYKKLITDDDSTTKKVGSIPGKGRLKKVNRRLKGFRLMVRQKLKWKGFWVTVMPSKRTLRMYSDVLNQMLKVDGSYPSIVFSGQWGLPVLSHPASRCRNYKINVSGFYTKPVSILA